MKLKLFFSVIIFSFVFSACLIKSFNPFYFKENIIFDSVLLGEWMDQDSTLWSFEEKSHEKGFLGGGDEKHHYKVRYTSKEGGTSIFMVVLFELDKVKYLDFFPDEETIEDFDLLYQHYLPVHSLAKINYDDPEKVSIKWFNEDWITNLLKKDKTLIEHQMLYSTDDDGMLVLSASTEKLQEFIRKFTDDPKAFEHDDDDTKDYFCRVLQRI